MKKVLPDILPMPTRTKLIPIEAKWLSGEGAGSWFHFEKSEEIRIVRLSPEGIVECEGVFTSDLPFEPVNPFDITYPSHCVQVTVVQYQQHIVLTRKS